MLQAPGATSYIDCIRKDKFGEEMKKKCTLDGVKVSLILWFVSSFLCDMLLCVWPKNTISKIDFIHSKNQINYYEIDCLVSDVAPCGACKSYIFFINEVRCFLKINDSGMEKEERWFETPLHGEDESRRSSPP